MKNKFTYVVLEADRNWKLRDLLKRRLGFSTRLLRKLKEEGGVQCNGRPVWLNVVCRPGDRLTIDLPEETSYFQPEDIPLDVVFEDEDLLILNKQPGMVVHPTKGHKEHTIANGLMKHMADRGETYKIRFINRLDMDTSGLLLVGKNSHCQDAFAKQAKANKVVKEYLAVVRGWLEEEEGVIELPIGKPSEDDPRRMVMEDGAPSVTRYRVIGRYGGGEGEDCGFGKGFSLVRLALETGRTHQIRVHMSYLGHPLLGDHLYGPEAAWGEGEAPSDEGQKSWWIGRQALHACYLSFLHPVTGERLEAEAALPEDLKDLLRRLEEMAPVRS